MFWIEDRRGRAKGIGGRSFGWERRWLVCVTALGLLLAPVSCRDKEPYKGSTGTPTKRGPWGRSAPPGVPAETMPIAVIQTPAGSILATSRPGGRDLDIRKIPVHTFVREDGTIVSFRSRKTSHGKATPSSRESVFVTLVMGGAGDDRELFPGAGHDRPDLDELGKIDPDMAKLYYHREQVKPLGISGPLFSWMVSNEGYLGGAHPYAESRLLVVDAETGGPQDLRARFKGRDPSREGQKALGSEDCVTRFAGVAPVDWVGGDATWVSVFTHEFEVCRGRSRLVKVAPPARRSRPAGDLRVQVADGVFEIPEEGLKVKGVADWRASPEADVAVLLMSLGRNDRLTPPWRIDRKGRADRRTREMRVWFRGMGAPAVIGRVTRILSVQFLNDHPDPKAVLASFAEL